MIHIDFGTVEKFDGVEFHTIDVGVISFEYSLKAIYEWEAIFKRLFLSGSIQPDEQLVLYSLMADRPVDPDWYTEESLIALQDYIASSNTATKFSDSKNQNGNNPFVKIKSSEEIYAEMFMLGVPLDFENRNLNRLLTVMKIINLKNQPPKKMSNEEILAQNAELNRQRRAQLNTKG